MGLNGQPLSALTSASYEMSYDADDAEGKTYGAPYFRVGVRLANGSTNVLVVTAGGPSGAVLTHVPLQNKIRRSAGGGADNLETYSSIAEALADPDLAGATISTYGIRLNLGWTGGANLTGVLRSFELNGMNYAFRA